MTEINAALDACLAEAQRHYVERRPESRRLHERAAEAMPGGNTRTVLFYTPFPAVLAKGEGCHVVDVDGHRYADFLGEYSAGLYGHSNPIIHAAVESALADGIVLGGPNRYEAELAHLLKERFPGIELVRFCNSGTEANLLAISTARIATGRDKILVFNHGYHGSVFNFGGNGAALNAPFPWITAPYNDTRSTLALIEAHRADLAAVLIEPMQGSSGGCIAAQPAFLSALREACARERIVLIFDEVMTSRSSPGGLQARLGITPDMTTLGKYLGGGLTFGAFAGRRWLMERFDPRRPDAIAHAGTFNNNVLAMAAGVAGLSRVLTAAECERLFGLGERLRDRLNAAALRRRAPFQATGVGSLIGLHFHDRPIATPDDLDRLDVAGQRRRAQLKELMHFDLMDRGIHYARRGYVSLSLPMREAEIDGFVAAIEEFLDSRASLIRL
jgi:glutamate-1-semialdehyde 2,1-aminomutase